MKSDKQWGEKEQRGNNLHQNILGKDNIEL